MPEHHLHFPRYDVVVVLVVATSMLKGRAQIVAVANDQIPFAHLVDHVVTQSHGPLANVALAFHASLPSCLFGHLRCMKFEAIELVQLVTMWRCGSHLPPAHGLGDEIVQLGIDPTGVGSNYLLDRKNDNKRPPHNWSVR